MIDRPSACATFIGDSVLNEIAKHMPAENVPLLNARRLVRWNFERQFGNARHCSTAPPCKRDGSSTAFARGLKPEADVAAIS